MLTNDGGHRGINVSSVGCSMWLYRSGALPCMMFCRARRVEATSSVDAEFMGSAMNHFRFAQWLRVPLDILEGLDLFSCLHHGVRLTAFVLDFVSSIGSW
jgi:hypothetical protein